MVNRRPFCRMRHVACKLLSEGFDAATSAVLARQTLDDDAVVTLL